MGAEVLKIITDDWRKARELILPLPGVQDVQSYGEAIHALVDSVSSRSANIKDVLVANKLKIIDMREISPRMEEAFISFIRKMDQEN